MTMPVPDLKQEEINRLNAENYRLSETLKKQARRIQALETMLGSFELHSDFKCVDDLRKAYQKQAARIAELEAHFGCSERANERIRRPIFRRWTNSEGLPGNSPRCARRTASWRSSATTSG